MYGIPSLIRIFKRDKKGVTALEYGLIAALISTVIIASVTTIGGNITTIFSTISTRMASGV
jgi:pilus assembly protein Flp/PilA